VVNLGGTAIGTGIAAPREYIFRVGDALRELTGLGLARAENLVDATQNADVFVEVSGLVRTLASSLIKISGDLRLLSSGPEGGLGEIRLPARQAGSSIMPGKVNPVIPEAVTQAAILTIGRDQALTIAASMGSLELNPFLPLVAHCLLENFDVLSNACGIFRSHCVAGIEADAAMCRRHVESATASATALVPLIGYARAAELVELARAQGTGLKDTAVGKGFVTVEQFEACTSAEAVCRLGFGGPRPAHGRDAG
jgi:aspartate ammonia-lyase